MGDFSILAVTFDAETELVRTYDAAVHFLALDGEVSLGYPVYACSGIEGRSYGEAAGEFKGLARGIADLDGNGIV